MLISLLILAASLEATASALVCVVTDGQNRLSAADVVLDGQLFKTDANGRVRIPVEAGSYQLTVTKKGFSPAVAAVTVADGEEREILFELQHQPILEEHVTVSALRTNARVEDQPMRVEVLGREEIEEKILMTPGDIVMMLNEMGGLRVQTTSPAIGAASIRVQGMRGRYTRFLVDGLPLFGQVGGLGLLQIPPSDLGQVEVIKGVASAIYGAGALGGVVDLISRRPAGEPVREALVNRTTRGATDAVFFAGQPFTDNWSGTLLAGGHWQDQNDADADGWADLAGYSRAVLRPRLFWDSHAGNSLFATAGMTWESRQGGTVSGATIPATGMPFFEALDTLRIDGGVVGQALLGGRYVLTARTSVTRQQHDHVLGEALERNRRDTWFAEGAIRGSLREHTWVAGGAFERDTLNPRDVPRFRYAYAVPGFFGQDDFAIVEWLKVSGSGRLDIHNTFGTFFSPRVSALVRQRVWNTRVSVGRGFFAPTPLIEETEAAGLSGLRVMGHLRAERGRSASWDVTRIAGPFRVTGTLFRYSVEDPVVVNRSTYSIANLTEPTINTGFEAVATFRRSPLNLTGTYTYISSREGPGPDRGDVPMTPRHSAGLIGVWEREGRIRIGLECYFTGTQRLEDNPFRTKSASYILFGGLVERRLGKLRLFLNAENLGDVRQTHWNPLLRPFRAVDGRWTVDAWAPLDGRVINGGVRIAF